MVVQSGEASPLHKDLQQTNDLLMQILTQMRDNMAPSGGVPTRVISPTTRHMDETLRGVVEFGR